MGGKKKIRHNIRLKLEGKKRQEIKRSNDTNPFELKRNKIKHQILGRRIAKNEIGKPLLNRSRAFQKRSQTLLEEYRNKHKGGKGLQDLRVGTEQRVTSKYKESQKEINLNKSEQIQLTHKGKPLEDFIDDRLSSDDEDIDLFNREDFIETTHFGGGLDGAPRSSRDVLKDVMQEKHEKKLAKQEAIELTEKLDSQWSELKSLLKHKGSNSTVGQNARDEYDNLLSQLMFEGKKVVKEVENIPSVTLQSAETSTTQSPDALFKAKLKLIDGSSDIDFVIKSLKDILSLLPNVTRKSFDLLKDRLQKLTLSSLKFTPKEMSILVISVYFKELQVVTHLMILKTLSKLKYQNYHEIAVSLFLLNFLLRTISEKVIYPELFIHVHNLIRLCMPMEKIKLALSTRLDYEAVCMLSVNNFIDDCKMVLSPEFIVTPFSLFGRTFVSESFDRKLVSYSLTVQVIQVSIALFEKYSQMAIVGKLMQPLRNDLQQLAQLNISNEIKALVGQFQEKFTKKATSIIINKILPKPIILPMLEPKFDERMGKKSKKDDDPRILTKKYKREMKGAQREIRKDTIFLRNTYLKDMEQKDRVRQQKVKEILRDISVQQGLYKKKK